VSTNYKRGYLLQFKPNTWEYDRVTLFLGEIYTGTCPSKLSLKIEIVKYGHESCGTHTRKMALVRPSSNCKLQTRPLVREGVPYKKKQLSDQSEEEEKSAHGLRRETDTKKNWPTDRFFST
jgi:hypothetical protein